MRMAQTNRRARVGHRVGTRLRGRRSLGLRPPVAPQPGDDGGNHLGVDGARSRAGDPVLQPRERDRTPLAGGFGLGDGDRARLQRKPAVPGHPAIELKLKTIKTNEREERLWSQVNKELPT